MAAAAEVMALLDELEEDTKEEEVDEEQEGGGDKFSPDVKYNGLM